MLHFLVDGQWTAWVNNWKPCTDADVNCRNGSTYRRERTCTNPKPFGGEYCKEDSGMEVDLGMSLLLLYTLIYFDAYTEGKMFL